MQDVVVGCCGNSEEDLGGSDMWVKKYLSGDEVYDTWHFDKPKENCFSPDAMCSFTGRVLGPPPPLPWSSP